MKLQTKLKHIRYKILNPLKNNKQKKKKKNFAYKVYFNTKTTTTTTTKLAYSKQRHTV